MTPPNKPEWIQLAETDSAPRVKRSARALPALVLATAMSIVGLGALVAQNRAETPAISSEQGINLSAAASPAEPSAPSVSASGKSSLIPTPKQPSIASLPTGGDDDDDEDDDDYDEDEGDDDDEDDEDDDH